MTTFFLEEKLWVEGSGINMEMGQLMDNFDGIIKTILAQLFQNQCRHFLLICHSTHKTCNILSRIHMNTEKYYKQCYEN